MIAEETPLKDLGAPRRARFPELLAPAGDWDCVAAAIENGADAIYFGLQSGFNARARAANFAIDDLPRLMETLHRRGLFGYATLNTLIFPNELDEFVSIIKQVAVAGVDAVLVQDVGAARIIREVCPDLPIHASTQMSLTSAESIRLAELVGCDRVVLARELSIDEITEIRQKTTMPVEVFVHGALCVAYSGQCLTSESLGGRSANRGQCAQACRLPYDLIQDGREIDLGAMKYLLSPQDLAAYELAPELIDAGICSFKIEGRLKTPEYVANITRHYRAAIDNAVARRNTQATATDRYEMEMSFSRGFSPGWLQGCDHKRLVPGESSSKRGVRVGTVTRIVRDKIEVELVGDIKRGDGVSFDCGRPVDDPQGGRVYEIFQRGKRFEGAARDGRFELAFGHGAIDFDEVEPGQVIWKTDDPELNNRLRNSFQGTKPRQRRRLRLHVIARVGEPLRVTGTLDPGSPHEVPHACDVASESAIVLAERHPLSEAVLREQLGRLGGTPFELTDLSAEIVGAPMVPLSVLGQVRKQMVQQLEAASTARPVRKVDLEITAEQLRANLGSPATTSASRSATLCVLVRSLRQLKQVLSLGQRELIAEFQDIREYREAVSAAREAGATIALATPRIQKPGETGLFHALAKHKADAIVVRNFAGLEFFRDRGVPVVGDFSLNIANDFSAAFYLSQGLTAWTPSYDLNREQLLDLMRTVDVSKVEVVVHQHMPMFHMEHCVFCAAISPGTNKTNCGRPCDEHQVQLRDRIGMLHPLHADVGCRNTLYNATPQSGAEIVPELLAAGVCRYRVELLDESPTETETILRLYHQLLEGDVKAGDVWRQLKASNRVGVTRGTLEERRNPLAIL
jgi:putative protease